MAQTFWRGQVDDGNIGHRLKIRKILGSLPLLVSSLKGHYWLGTKRMVMVLENEKSRGFGTIGKAHREWRQPFWRRKVDGDDVLLMSTLAGLGRWSLWCHKASRFRYTLTTGILHGT